MIPYRLIDDAERLKDLLDTVFLLASDLAPDTLFANIVLCATRLAAARYAALIVLEPDQKSVSQVVHLGMDPAAIEAISKRSELPGVLADLVGDPRPLRLAFLEHDPELIGVPADQPEVRGFLGVPIRLGTRLFAVLYLLDKDSEGGFDDQDEAAIAALGFAAGVAAEINSLNRRVRDLTVMADRERIAMELHDKVIGRLFSLGLSLQTAARSTAGEVAVKLTDAVDDLDGTIRDIRNTIFSLDPLPDPLVDGFAPSTLRSVGGDEL